MLAKHAADDDTLPRQFIGGSLSLLLRKAHLQAIVLEALQNLQVDRIVEIGDDALGDDFTDPLNLLKVL